MKKIDIIILHYGDPKVTQTCIASIEQFVSSYRSLIIVNNDPQIKIEKIIKPTAKRVCINTGANLGFARGVNKGIELALKNKADYVVLLNNDTSVTEDFVAPLYEVLESDKKIGIVGPIIKFKKGNDFLYDHGGMIATVTGSTEHENYTSITKTKLLQVDFISGCCMMVRKELFAAVGTFDPRYFMYYEDVDFCLRARRKGYTIVVVTNAIINHALSKTVGKNSSALLYHLTRSRLLFSRTHPEFPLRFFSLVIQSLKFMIKDPSKTGMIVKGLRGR